jgi:hypothetical protein
MTSIAKEKGWEGVEKRGLDLEDPRNNNQNKSQMAQTFCQVVIILNITEYSKQ